MDKESFKVGDKVVLRDPMSRIQGNNIGTVKRFLSPEGVIVDWRENGREITSFYLQEEIKRACPKGKQKLFSFMYEN